MQMERWKGDQDQDQDQDPQRRQAQFTLRERGREGEIRQGSLFGLGPNRGPLVTQSKSSEWRLETKLRLNMVSPLEGEGEQKRRRRTGERLPGYVSGSPLFLSVRETSEGRGHLPWSFHTLASFSPPLILLNLPLFSTFTFFSPHTPVRSGILVMTV